MRIALLEFRPEVWRRVFLPGSMRLDQLHLVFQAALGWTNSHVHQFRIDGDLYGMHLDDYPDEELNEVEFRVTDVAHLGDRFFYDYDLGDSWEHEVLIERVSTISPALKFAVCVDGANACPLEDCGGTGGYAELIQVLSDPRHKDHEDFSHWVGADFDPTAFDVATTNAALQRVR